MSGIQRFELISDFLPAGDQPNAINALVSGINNAIYNQVLLGVTGSGKTFTMAHVITQIQRPTLILAPNKTLAAQLYGEMKGFFPNNAVEYFVSYYDYYQPEAYIPSSDTYIEKETAINEQIDRMRHSATRSLLERKDVIIVASVSCIYGIGAVELYSDMAFSMTIGQHMPRDQFLKRLTELQYRRSDSAIARGTFRVRGDTVDLFPAHLQARAWRFSFFGDEIEAIHEIDPVTGHKLVTLKEARIYPNSHYVTPKPTLHQAIEKIRHDLNQELDKMAKHGKLIEAQRLEQRTMFDIEMMQATGICPGIENYSRYLTGRKPGEPPPTLFEYLPRHALLFIDECHVMVPQLRGMFQGDFKRKSTLMTYGFRLPACIDNRPLKFEEWEQMRPQTIFVSATPGAWELSISQGSLVEQVVRPTGLIDPVVLVRPVDTQVDDLIAEARSVVEQGMRVMVTTLTKKMAEALSEYLHEIGLRVRYLHSDIDTLERIEIIRDLRRGVFDVLIGINLLREGLDIPECALIAILDADKEGFLRSTTSLIQTIGRAARNIDGRAILYADIITESMRVAIEETNRRRIKQQAYNLKHHITPESVKNMITDILESIYERADHVTVTKPSTDVDSPVMAKDLHVHITALKKKMRTAARNLEFEEAARLRDEIHRLEMLQLQSAETMTT